MTKVAPIRRAYHRHDNAECGHGTCAAKVDCTGECAMKSLPVIDEQIDMPAAYEESNPWEWRIVAAILIAVTAFSIYMATQ